MSSGEALRQEQEMCHAMLVELGKGRLASDARLAHWVARGARVGVHRLVAMGSLVDYLVEVVGMDEHTAQEWKRVGTALGTLPILASAMDRGEVRFSAAKEVTRVATPETDREWTEAARQSYRTVQKLVRFKQPGDLPTTVVQPEAMPRRMQLWLSPEEFAFVTQAIDRAKRKAGRSLRLEEALAMVSQAYVEGGDGTQRRMRTTMFQCERCKSTFMDAGADRIRIDTTPAALAETSRAGPAPAADRDEITARATSRAGGSVAPTYDEAALVMDARSRHIPMEARRQVFERCGGKCSVPGCSNRLFLHFHHLDAFSKGGTHDPSRIALVCSSHHRAIHDGRMRVEGSVEEGLRFVPARAAPAAPSTWELAEGALHQMGFKKHEAREYVTKAQAANGDGEPTIEYAVRLALAQFSFSGVREDLAVYLPC